MEANQPAAAEALEGLRKKQNQRSRWAKIAGGLVLFAAVVRLASVMFGGETIRSCDETEVQSAVSDIMNEAIKKSGSAGSVQSYTEVQEVQSDSKSRLCSAHVTMTDQTSGKVTYRIVPKKVSLESFQ
jgi:hypothetical protein